MFELVSISIGSSVLMSGPNSLDFNTLLCVYTHTYTLSDYSEVQALFICIMTQCDCVLVFMLVC